MGRDSAQVVRAHRDGIDRYLAIHHGDPGCDPRRGWEVRRPGELPHGAGAMASLRPGC